MSIAEEMLSLRNGDVEPEAEEHTVLWQLYALIHRLHFEGVPFTSILLMLLLLFCFQVWTQFLKMKTSFVGSIGS